MPPERELDGKFQVNDILLLGNTIFTEEQVAEILAPYSGRLLTLGDIQNLRTQLSQYYLQQGYINSGVLLPERALHDGVLTLLCVEGKLTQVDVEHGSALADDYIASQLQQYLDGPLRLDSLQTSLRQLELNPLVGRLNAQLLPGLRPGESSLRLKVHDERPYSVVLGFDNQRSPSVGAERAVLSATHRNLTGRRDRINLSLSASEGLSDAYISYSLPINNRDTQIELDYRIAQSEVVEQPFDDLNIESDTQAWNIGLRHYLHRSSGRQVELFTAIGHSRSETSLLGQSFSFSLGARDGEIKSSSASIGIEWVERLPGQVIAVRTALRSGLDWFGATRIPDGAARQQLATGAKIPESKYTLLLTQLQYARRVNWLDSQLIISGVWQEALDPLLAVDKFAVGGAYSVRGFRENQLVRDNGIAASLAWRIPVTAVTMGELTLSPFFDYGRSWDEDNRLSTHDAAVISSVGFALDWQPRNWLQLRAAWGVRLEDGAVEDRDDDLQDDGIHFSLHANWP
jgi:hemolysin activation/secretion protein